MTFKELSAGVQIVGVVVVGGWLAWDVAQGGLAEMQASDIAIKLLWAVGVMVVFNVAGGVLATIIVSMVQGEELKDEPADERDMAIEARSLKNGGIATSVVAALALIPLAMGFDPKWAVYALFVAPVIGGTVNAVFQLYYYRTM